MGSRALVLSVAVMLVAAACAGLGGLGGPARSGPSPLPAPAGFPLTGAWTTTITREDLRAGGVTEPGLLNENSGRYTWVFEADGTWRTVSESLDGATIMNPVFAGTYVVEDGVVIATTDFPDIYRDEGLRYRFELNADGSVRFDLRQPPDPSLPIIVETHPWQRANG
jgi:hypothetical protein